MSNKTHRITFAGQAILGLVLALLVCPEAQADSGKTFRKSLTLTPSAGIQTSFRFGTLVPTPQTADVPPIDILLERGGPVWGLSLGYRFSPHFELQAELLYGRTRVMNDVGIGLAGIPLGKVKTSDADSYSCGGRLLYYLSSGKLSPYLAVGAGAATLATDEFGSKTRPLISFSAGLKIRLSPRLSAVIDLRNNLTFFRFIQDFGYFFPLIYNSDFKTSQYSFAVSLGLGYFF